MENALKNVWEPW